MNNGEAITIAKIASTADGGCVTCVGSMCRRLHDAFPEHDWPHLIYKHGERSYWDEDDLRSRIPEEDE